MRHGRHLRAALLAGAVLSLPAAAGEIELGGEGYAFTLRDTGYSSLLRGVPNSERPTLEPPRPLDLAGLGWRAQAAFVFHGGADRVGVSLQRVRDEAHGSLSTRLGTFTLEQAEQVEAALTTVDARYERRVSSSERFELRIGGGYRFARLVQSSELTGSCPACRDLLVGRLARVAAEDRVTAHGLRAGLVSDVRLAGPLHFESEAGLALLAATQRDVNNVIDLVVRDTQRRRSLATWDLAARLRAEWNGVSLHAGYRFERWSGVSGLTLAGPDTGFDGFTFGLGWRVGL